MSNFEVYTNKVLIPGNIIVLNQKPCLYKGKSIFYFTIINLISRNLIRGLNKYDIYFNKMNCVNVRILQNGINCDAFEQITK